MNSDEGNKFDEKNKFDSQKVAEYRKRMMSGPLKSGKEVFGEWFSLREEEANENGFDQMWTEMKDKMNGLGFEELYEFDCQKYQKVIDVRKGN